MNLYTAEKLRANGHTVIFRGFRVIVRRTDLTNGTHKGLVLSTQVDKGEWMRRPMGRFEAESAGAQPWAMASDLEKSEIEAVEAVCYCATCTSGCDYCTDVRAVPMECSACGTKHSPGRHTAEIPNGPTDDGWGDAPRSTR